MGLQLKHLLETRWSGHRDCAYAINSQAPRCDFESGGAKISKWGSMSDGTLRGYFVLK